LLLVVATIVGSATAASAAPPGAPPQPTVAPFNGSIVVIVDKTTVPDGGNAIDSFSAQCVPVAAGTAGSGVVATSPADPSTTIAVQVLGLTNGDSYTCTIFAHNADGFGPSSPPSSPTTPSSVPSAPAAPTLQPQNGMIVVSFTPPFDGGSPILNYSVSCTSPDGGVGGSGSGPTSPITVGSLSNGKTYTCTVTASNAQGNGPPSPQSAGGVPGTVPDTPAAPSVTSSIVGSLSVSFTPPFDGGSPITGYTADCTPSDGSAPLEVSGTASPLLVNGVSIGTSYTCTLVAVNQIGSSGTSPASSPVIPGTTPDAPAQPTVAAGNASIAVTFAPVVPPFDGGSAVIGYTAHCASSVDSSDQDGTASPITVGQLTNGVSYTCTVAAKNQYGAGPASPASAAVTPQTVPSAPPAPTAVPANASITVTYTAPASGGFPIIQYRVSCSSTNGGAAGFVMVTAPGLSGVVTGLTNGASYRCNVTANSSVGSGLPSPPSAVVTPHGRGFRIFTGDGSVYAFGDSPFYGSTASAPLVIAMMTMPDNHGYWLVNKNGAVYPHGSAKSYGSLVGHALNKPIVGGTATRTGRGYWLVASDGGIFAFGDAHFYGSTGNIRLAQPIVGMTATASGQGYWFVAADGGMFAFGNAHFYGSAAGRRKPIVGMATAAGGTGYWIAANDGTVFAFGSAGLGRGAIGAVLSSRIPIMGMAATDTGHGYWLVTAYGVVYTMGDAPFIPWPHPTRLARIVRGISR
jgi:ribosomal protein L24E